MLRISEHFEYYNKDHSSALEQFVDGLFVDTPHTDTIYWSESEDDLLCVSIVLNKEGEKFKCKISSSYFIGLDTLPKLKVPVLVEPKVNTENQQINYVGMLMEALTEPKNFNNLEGLYRLKHTEPWIPITNDLQPLLTPFLLAQFLSVVKDLVKRGLKKSYYPVVENLDNRIKGKVLVGSQIKYNLLKNRPTKTFCSYQEFGIDTEANQFIKFVLQEVTQYVDSFYHKSELYTSLSEILHYCTGGFYQVSHKEFKSLQYKETNPFYKNYNKAIQLGNQILALKDYNISKNAGTGKVMHPPFWIDMSKLFELFVFKKLREEFPGEGEVKYHQKVNRQEPDFIIHTPQIKAVVDAKYKPRYKKGNPSIDDARQLAGYTRLNKMYEELKMNDDSIIPAYFVYPGNLSNIEEKKEEEEVFDEKMEASDKAIFNTPFRESTMYWKMYLQEIYLPVVS